MINVQYKKCLKNVEIQFSYILNLIKHYYTTKIAFKKKNICKNIFYQFYCLLWSMSIS